ncbi:hypothetical protein [Rhizobium ruizarguesonis]|uniref:hypothetical protein n=1 Tax=Rhizobium ruizarguesonis TaxID=2081791 RepID=UPI00103181F2|nr:hypothetical protein [Rhizobium ruizarguesonis]TBE67408.1 hypothetical protein ELH00_16195 [Rhizobium ruizarguesonis]
MPWTIGWNIIVWLASSKIGRAILGGAIIVFFILGFRIWLAAHDASVARQATAQMVTKFERDALASQLATEQRLRSEANRAAAEARERAAATQKASDAANAEVERLLSEATKNGKLSRPTEEDRLWLDQH